MNLVQRHLNLLKERIKLAKEVCLEEFLGEGRIKRVSALFFCLQCDKRRQSDVIRPTEAKEETWPERFR